MAVMAAMSAAESNPYTDQQYRVQPSLRRAGAMCATPGSFLHAPPARLANADMLAALRRHRHRATPLRAQQSISSCHRAGPIHPAESASSPLSRTFLLLPYAT